MTLCLMAVRVKTINSKPRFPSGQAVSGVLGDDECFQASNCRCSGLVGTNDEVASTATVGIPFEHEASRTSALSDSVLSNAT